MTVVLITDIKQQGAALILSLILLMAMTMLGLSSTRSAILEEKMFHNMRDIAISFEAAEAGLREVETWLQQQTSKPLVNERNFVYLPDELPEPIKQNHQWWVSLENTGTYGIDSSAGLEQVKLQPRFVLEYVSFLPDTPLPEDQIPNGIHIYRATCRATGASNASQSILQTTLSKRFNSEADSVRRLSWRQLR